MARTRVTFELDRAGVQEVLKSPGVRAVVDEAAQQIAERVRADVPPDVEVEVRPYSTDREAASITIRDVRGMAWQARRGVLTRAAAGIGAEVKERGR
jgi:hypothetical protein